MHACGVRCGEKRKEAREILKGGGKKYEKNLQDTTTTTRILITFILFHASFALFPLDAPERYRHRV